jgi:glycosyltransferase involved in cell wall biosynthesis
MRVLAFGNQHSGCMWHRVAMPLGFMNDIEAHLTNVPTQEIMAKHWDILLYNRLCPFDRDWDAFRKTDGTSHIKIVMDLDDWWVLPPSHVNYPHYKNLQPRIENNIRNADLVTVTHERLAEKVRPFNENVVIMPNALPFGQNQYTDDQVPSDKFRLFWAGGISHVRDLELLRNPMKRIKTLGGIETVIGGYAGLSKEELAELWVNFKKSETEEDQVKWMVKIQNDKETKYNWDRMISAFTCSLTIPGKVLQSLPVHEYMNHWLHADVLLVPLEDTPWHGMKSNLKLLEAASKKIPVICSKVQPYIEGNPPVLWVESQGDWFKHVKDLKYSKELRAEMSTRLWEWAQQFDLMKVNEKRRQCFQNLLKPSNGINTITSSMSEQESLSASA